MHGCRPARSAQHRHSNAEMEPCGPAKAARRLKRREVALQRACEGEGLAQLPRPAGARALLVMHGGLSAGHTHAEIDAALRGAVRPVVAEATLWHAIDCLWSYVLCETPDEALAAFDLLHARPLAALPRHVLVAALVDQGAVVAAIERQRASSSPVCATRVPGLRLLEEYVDEVNHDALVLAIETSGRWEQRSEAGRKVQHFGLRFNYGTVRADTEGERPPWPAWCAGLGARLVADGIMPSAPNQVTVNEYRPGEGIPYHCDTHSAFGPVICSLR
jgi:alkylated DNA repair dioxygenase AlkB